MERKYSFEAGLDVYASYKTIISVENLRKLKERDKHPYHIYGILSYNQIFFRKEKLKQTKDGIKLGLFMIEDGKEVDYDLPYISFIEEIDHRKIDVQFSYPAVKMTLSIKDETFLKQYPEINKSIDIMAQEFFTRIAEELVPREKYEVLYIGQSYGDKGSRTAFERLERHETLQKILTEYKGNHPDKHIYILLLEMSTRLAMSFDSVSKIFTKNEDESSEHLKEVCSNLPIENQVINITEAAMINYFKPMYNTNFVENFPDKKHKGYKQYFDLDYNSLTVEINLEFDNTPSIQLYTDSNKIESSFDVIQYELFNDNNRKSMYDIFEKRQGYEEIEE